MTRSQWQAHENMKATKPTKADEARQKAAMEAHDRAMLRLKRKERMCMLAFWACIIVVGSFFLYCLYLSGA